VEICPFAQKARTRSHFMLTSTPAFTSEEVDVAMEMNDVVRRDSNQKDYEIYSML
jgi:hypothetical protein